MQALHLSIPIVTEACGTWVRLLNISLTIFLN